jgi:hypothetical protein
MNNGSAAYDQNSEMILGNYTSGGCFDLTLWLGLRMWTVFENVVSASVLNIN